MNKYHHKLLNTERKRTLIKNIEKEANINNDIMNYFGAVRHSTLLDRMPDFKDHKQQFQTLINNKKAQAITITFKEIIRNTFDEDDLRLILNNIIKVLNERYNMKISIVMIPDVDDKGNFHYHGVISILKKHTPKFRKMITNNIGFMKFSYITDIEGWTKYCYKEDIYDEDDYKKLTIII